MICFIFIISHRTISETLNFCPEKHDSFSANFTKIETPAILQKVPIIIFFPSSSSSFYLSSFLALSFSKIRELNAIFIFAGSGIVKKMKKRKMLIIISNFFYFRFCVLQKFFSQMEKRENIQRNFFYFFFTNLSLLSDGWKSWTSLAFFLLVSASLRLFLSLFLLKKLFFFLPRRMRKKTLSTFGDGKQRGIIKRKLALLSTRNIKE